MRVMMARTKSVTSEITIRELKHRYKMLLAQGLALPIADQGAAIPVSTGSPFLDSMLNEKVATTPTINAEEHLMRSWLLASNASKGELDLAIANIDGCMNDHKLLLAVRLFASKDERYNVVLSSLPMKWKLMFPIAMIKPASVFFESWKRDIRFRLVGDIDYPALKKHYHETLANARDDAVLKFREIIKEALALLHWKPEGNRENAIHEWCFGSGKRSDAMPLLSLYLDMRDAFNKGNYNEFVSMQMKAERPIPLTSYMGLLSSRKFNLNLYEGERFRDGALRAASPIEFVLRLNEWGHWISTEQLTEMSKMVRSRVEKGLGDIPFYKITQAYLATNDRTRATTFDELYVPMMKGFSKQMGVLIPKGSEVIMVQPNNFVNLMSILFLATISYERGTRMKLVGEKIGSVDSQSLLNFDELRSIVTAPIQDAQQFLLDKFGGHALARSFTFNENVLVSAFDDIKPEDIVIIDMPFVFSVKLLEKLLHIRKVLNMSSHFGSPSEISLHTQYEDIASFVTKRFALHLFTRYSDSAVKNLANYIERLVWFERMAGGMVPNKKDKTGGSWRARGR